MHDLRITPSQLLSIAKEAVIDPVILGVIVENEYIHRKGELSQSASSIRIQAEAKAMFIHGHLGPQALRANLLAGTVNSTEEYLKSWDHIKSPSLGVSQLNEYLAHRLTQQNETLASLRHLNRNELGDRYHSDHVLALRLTAHHLRDLYRDIERDLENAVGIKIDTYSKCAEWDTNCSISYREQEDLVIVAYNQGWKSPLGGGVHDLLVKRRGNDVKEWYAGIQNTLKIEQVSQVRQHYQNVRECLSLAPGR